MSVLPARTLQITLNEPLQSKYIADGPYSGYEYAWRAILDVTPQTHFSAETTTPYQYDGNDIKVGDWFATTDDGIAARITEIVTPGPSQIEVWFEDVDNFNLISDPTLNGIARPINGNGYLFPLGEDGLPAIVALPSFAMGVNFQDNLSSRFRARNPIAFKIPISQPDHGLSAGDIVYLTALDEEGIYTPQYVAIVADDSNKDNLERIVGQVVEVVDSNNFTLKPFGEFKTNISPTLPGDRPGQLLYVSPTFDGELTVDRPTNNVKIIAVRLSDTSAYYIAGAGGSGSSSPLGYYSTVYKVANITERDNLDTTQLKIGDQAFVVDDRGTEWGHYIVSNLSADPTPVATWTLLGNQDSSTVDGRTVGAIVNYEDVDPINIYSLSPTTRVVLLTIEVITPFHPSAYLTVGDEDVVDLLAGQEDSDLSVVGTYSISPSYQFGGMDETMIQVFVTPGPSSAGEAKVTISYI